MTRPTPGRRGFTLIEVVLAVAAGLVLLGVMISTFTLLRRSGERTQQYATAAREMGRLQDALRQSFGFVVVKVRPANRTAGSTTPPPRPSGESAPDNAEPEVEEVGPPRLVLTRDPVTGVPRVEMHVAKAPVAVKGLDGVTRFQPAGAGGYVRGAFEFRPGPMRRGESGRPEPTYDVYWVALRDWAEIDAAAEEDLEAGERLRERREERRARFEEAASEPIGEGIVARGFADVQVEFFRSEQREDRTFNLRAEQESSSSFDADLPAYVRVRARHEQEYSAEWMFEVLHVLDSQPERFVTLARDQDGGVGAAGGTGSGATGAGGSTRGTPRGTPRGTTRVGAGGGTVREQPGGGRSGSGIDGFRRGGAGGDKR